MRLKVSLKVHIAGNACGCAPVGHVRQRAERSDLCHLSLPSMDITFMIEQFHDVLRDYNAFCVASLVVHASHGFEVQPKLGLIATVVTGLILLATVGQLHRTWKS